METPISFALYGEIFRLSHTKWESKYQVAREGTGFPPIVAVWFLAIPLLDMVVVIAGRIRRGQSPFMAGRDHFHHVLIAAGLAPAVAVLPLLALALGMRAIGFLAWRAGVPDYWMF